MREYYHKHKEERKEYRKKNSELYRKYYKQKRKTDINYKLAHNLRRRLRGVLNNKSKKSSVLNLLGCSLKEFKKHLENKFNSKMTWKNYGKVWEIDHIKPCVSFDLSKLKQQKQCFNYKNLQPLTVKENRSKRHGLRKSV